MLFLNILFTGGGTAGHINPGLAVANSIKDKYPDSNIMFVGTKSGLERDLVPNEGFKIEYINVQGIERKITLNNLKTAMLAGAAFFQSCKIIKKFKPDVVVGTGGYVCGPVVLAASFKKIPTVIHEQNVFPGMTIKMLSKIADITAISYEESRKYINTKKKVVVTGNPIRDKILTEDYLNSRKKLRIDKEPLILAFGGSLGAEYLNKSFIEFIKIIYPEQKYNLILGTGPAQFDYVKKRLSKYGIPVGNNGKIRVLPYIFNMEEVLAASDLVICRAGAITLSEITAVGKPSLLIPSPYVADNHQEYNARALERAGASIVLKEEKLDGKVLYHQVNKLINNKPELEKMGKKAKELGKPEATNKLVKIVLSSSIN